MQCGTHSIEFAHGTRRVWVLRMLWPDDSCRLQSQRTSRKWNKIQTKAFITTRNIFAARNDETVDFEILKHKSKTWCIAYRVCGCVCVCVLCIIINSLHSPANAVVRVQQWTSILYFNQMVSTISTIFLSATSSSVVPHRTPAADHMFYSLAFILFRIWIFCSPAIFSIFTKEISNFEPKPTGSRLICTLHVIRKTATDGNISDVCFFLLFVHNQYGSGQLLAAGAYADVDDNNEHDTAAAILMGLYWSLAV